MAKLGEIFKLSSGRSLPEKNRIKGKYNVYGGNGITGYHNDYFVNQSTIVIGRVGEYCGAVHLTSEKCWVTDNALMVTSWLTEVDKNYMAYLLNAKNLHQYAKTVGQPSISQGNIYDLEIPLPPLETQKQIAANLDKVTHTIDLCNAILEKLDLLVKARFVELFGCNAKRRKLNEYAELITKGASPKWQGVDYCEKGTLFVTSENVREGYLELSKKKYLDDKINEIQPRSMLKRNDILINIVGASIGRAAVYDCDEIANINQAVALVRVDYSQINKTYLMTFLNSTQAIEMYSKMKKGGARDNLSLQNIADLQIPIAPMDQQNEFATFVEQTDKSKSAVKQVLEKAETLKKALMQEYFG